MKLRFDIADGNPEEIILRAPALNKEVRRLQAALEAAMGGACELALYRGDEEYFVPISELLFFETDGGKLFAHTKDSMFESEDKLYELERRLPPSFVRVSKSCLVNSAMVSSLRHGVTGTAEACFFGSTKKAYISRMYYKVLKEIIYETRLQK